MTTQKNIFPGFKLPLDHLPKSTYPIAPSCKAAREEGLALPLTTFYEFEMIYFMDKFTNEVDWWTKVHDSSYIADKRREHMYSGLASLAMFDYCIEELQCKSRLRHLHVSNDHPSDSTTLAESANTTAEDNTTAFSPVMVYDDAGVIKHDSALSDSLQEELRAALDAFEAEVLEEKKKMNRSSIEDSEEFVGGRSLKFIDPSMYPLVFGKSRIIEHGRLGLDDCVIRCGEGVEVDANPEVSSVAGGESDQESYSKKYQWLPCEVDISGSEARITSYIPSVHPSHTNIYTLLSKLITHCIPLWEESLSAVYTTPHPQRQNQSAKNDLQTQIRIRTPLPPRIPYHFVTYDNDPGSDSDNPDMPVQEPGEDYEDYINRKWEFRIDMRQEQIPEPDEVGFRARVGGKRGENVIGLNLRGTNVPRLDMRRLYGATGIQVIIQAQDEVFNAGEETNLWRVVETGPQGVMNEHIIATAIYVYSVESSDVGPPQISFKQQFENEDISMIDHDMKDTMHRWLSTIFQVDLDEAKTQLMGSMDTKQGRLIVFPNILQTDIAAQIDHPQSKCHNPEKEDRWKAVTIHLVDPNVRIMSTAYVPAQNRDWWWDEVMRCQGPGSGRPCCGMLHRLPLELLNMVKEYVGGFPMSPQEAEDIRGLTSSEREEINQKWCVEFDGIVICDH